MEASSSVSQIKTGHQFSAPSSIFKPKNGYFPSPVFHPPVQRNAQKEKRALRVECEKGLCSSVEKKTMEDGFDLEKEEIIGMKELINENCKSLLQDDDEDDDDCGVVELLECLERESIMGDDEGKNPNDYNRRALIFDKSSRVFQALKHQTSAL